MTLTNDEPITPPADTVGDAGPGRQPIDDVEAYLDTLPDHARIGLRALRELLVDEDRDLEPVSRLTTAVALAEWITSHANVIEVGPGEYALPPAWTQTEIGGRAYRHPQCLRVHFPAGSGTRRHRVRDRHRRPPYWDGIPTSQRLQHPRSSGRRPPGPGLVVSR
jgi:hypothetical protein